MYKPLLRSIKYKYLYYSACRYVSSKRKISDTPLLKTSFIVGCGRSGTSLLGDLIGLNPEVSYLFEPYYLWSAIDAKLDILNLFNVLDPVLVADADFFCLTHKTAFECCLQRFSVKRQAHLFLEKTPLNIFRIGWLNKVAPGSRFVHIIRDGFDVCASIARLSATDSYKIFGKPNLNQWWGNDYSKWKTLYREGRIAGYFPQEVGLLDTHLKKAAYEWLLSLKEIDRWRHDLSDRLYEIIYDELVEQPRETLSGVAEFLGIQPTTDWLNRSIGKIKPSRISADADLLLPSGMCKVFNEYQERYGFMHRAKSEVF